MFFIIYIKYIHQSKIFLKTGLKFSSGKKQLCCGKQPGFLVRGKA